ncbi:MAG: hypothetical protein JNJ60_21465 [Rhodocyclaceae bacterium]|nr:hypothetical protein [Rhodocyclaceae bacterium]
MANYEDQNSTATVAMCGNTYGTFHYTHYQLIETFRRANTDFNASSALQLPLDRKNGRLILSVTHVTQIVLVRCMPSCICILQKRHVLGSPGPGEFPSEKFLLQPCRRQDDPYNALSRCLAGAAGPSRFPAMDAEPHQTLRQEAGVAGCQACGFATTVALPAKAPEAMPHIQPPCSPDCPDPSMYVPARENGKVR